MVGGVCCLFLGVFGKINSLNFDKGGGGEGVLL